MMVDDPGFDAFESATHAQLRARELGKIEAFIPNLWSNALVPESMGISMLRDGRVISQAVWFGRITGRSWNIQRIDFSRVPFLRFLRMAYRWNLWSGSSGSGGTAIFTESSCPGPAHGNFISFSGRTRQRCFEIADWGYIQANSASRRQWRANSGCAGWAASV